MDRDEQRARETPGWWPAVDLTARWRQRRGRADVLLEERSGAATSLERGAAQRLFFGAIRHWRRIAEGLRPWMQRPPRPRLEALLAVAAAEILDDAAAVPAEVVDHAVEQAKRNLSMREARMVNAVLRRAVPAWREAVAPAPGAAADELGSFFSHPTWLVEKWTRQFGVDAAWRLLEWNQTPAVVHVRWRAAGEPLPDCLATTPWPGFGRLKSGRWGELAPAIAAGWCYLQDPATRLVVELAAPRPGESALDLCAAPGGKGLQLADILRGGRLVSVDRPGARLRRLEENLVRWRAGGGGTDITVLGADVQALTPESLADRGLPAHYEIVVLDVPCSNTGVLRHRVDAKWRLEADEFKRLAETQGRLLVRAAAFVRPDGRLLYSTCSLEPEENEAVVTDFLAGETGQRFVLEQAVHGRPWEHGHDGAGVFRLRRKT